MRHSIVKTGMILALTCTAFRVYPESGPQIWSIPIPRFTEDIKKGETGFLASMDPALLDPSHVKNLGPGGGLYLSYIFEKLKKQEEAVLMLETEITNRKAAGDESGGIFLREAAYRLLALQTAKKSAEALERAEALVVAAVEDRRVFYLLAEGYFRLKRDKDAIRNLDRAVTQRFGILSAEEAARSEFLRAAAGARLGLPGWDRLYLGLFTSQPSSAIIGEAYEFLGREKISLSPFDADEQGFLRARYDTYKQEYHKAQTSFSKLIAKRSAPALSVQGILDAGKAIAGSGESKKGAQALKELGDSLSRSILPDAQLKASAAYRVSGNLSRRLSKYPEAKAAYTEALKGASAQDRDRIIWAMMSCDLSSSPETLVKNLPGYIPLTADPSFFSDILEDLSTALVTKRDFESFPEAFKAIEPWADGETVARYAYITLRAMEEGYIPETNRKPLLDAVFSRHAKSSSAFYYLFLLSVREGKHPIRFYAETKTASREEPPRNGAEQLCTGFLSFGLRDEAYAAAAAYADQLSEGGIRRISSGLIEEGGFYEALRLFTKAVSSESFVLTKDDLGILFPDAYGKEIEKACAKEGLDTHIFTGLVREESFFKADIVSHAGAVGLSQLMPSTAKDVAGRLMGMRRYDILDPATNLAIGAYYLSHLLSRTADIPQALFAYNGGLTRVKRWAAAGKDLPRDLFVESVPIQETRHYLRKVLVSSVLYGYLYDGKEPASVIEEFFPSFTRKRN